MGSQDEYLRDFVVVMTERGVVPITDPLQIAVYNELCTGSKRPSDIAASLGIASSSLHFVLDKMVDAGVIFKSKPEQGKKSVYYSTLAHKVFGSVTPTDASKVMAESTFSDPARYYGGLSSVAEMFDRYTSEVGLDLGRLRADYAEGLADEMCRDMPVRSMEESLHQIKEAFARVTGFRFSVFALTPLTLVFEGDRVMSGKMDMLTRLVSRCLEKAAGRTYAVTSIEDFSGDDTCRYKVVYDRTERQPEPYMNTSLPQSQHVDPFMMVDLDGSVGLITSEVQIQIVDAVYERPLCVTDIVNKVAAPRSTVTSNILRMVEEGVISVFYAESGSAYYGLSCSILMKRSRGMSRDSAELRSVLRSAASKEGSFMEGYLLYTLSVLKGLGFDTDYMMVVLGAKYMRTAGREGPHNFDVYFGKMSDISRTIGLSLNVVSVYPLTIGITSDNPESEMSPAMTFVKGMAHQGLEMASNGIFVRNSEDTEAQRKVSFKEIYPALSMTPAEGMKVEGLAEEVPSKKKRTSSVKTALLNRSAKEGGKPTRTVRYITGMTMAVLLTAVLIFGLSGVDNSANSDVYAVSSVDAPGLEIYDIYTGEPMDLPLNVEGGQTIAFTASVADGDVFGMVTQGKAYPLESDNGVYRVTVDANVSFQVVRSLELPAESEGLSVSVYNFDSQVSEKYAYGFSGYIDVTQYEDETGGLWIGSTGVVCIESSDGEYISDGGDDGILWERYVTGESDLSDIESDRIGGYTTVHLSDDYELGEMYLTGDVKVSGTNSLRLQFTTTNGPVEITVNGERTELSADGYIHLDIEGGDVWVQYRHSFIA